MRQLHRKKELEQSRVDRLKLIDFEFAVAKSDMVSFSVVWDKSYQAVKVFRDAHGHCEVPEGYRPQPNQAELDGWIKRQRLYFKKEKLPEHLAAKLRSLGINLKGKGRPFGIDSEEAWKIKYQDLVEYYEENGDCDVPDKVRKYLELGKIRRAYLTCSASAVLSNLVPCPSMFSRSLDQGAARCLRRPNTP